jgi:hypothetical protein
MRERIVCHLTSKTKGALQYKQVDASGEPVTRDEDGQIIGTFYLRKAAVKGKPPEEITVTVEY